MRVPRFERLPDGHRIRVYDAGPKFADRYTILFEDMEVQSYERGEIVVHLPRPYGNRQALFLGGSPDSPQGFSQWGECPPPLTYGPGARHKRIPFMSLPENVRQHVIQRGSL